MEVETSESFELWISTRLDDLLRFAVLVTGSQRDGEDALQTALASAFERWDHVGGREQVDRYVRRMIANAHVTAWRRFAKRQFPVAEVRGTRVDDDSACTVQRDLVWQVCLDLPRQQRAAVVLRYYEDLETREIAEILGCSEVTVRSHLHRALARLRTDLERGEHDG